jgi:predicted dehydrogenase
MKKQRIGVLGFGFIGAIHTKAILHCPDAELAGVWTQPDHTMESYRNLCPDGRVYTSMQELVEDPDVDAVVIGLPNAFHLPQALAAFGRGKHVMVEKPMAMSVEEAETMARAAVQNDRRLMVGHMWRFDREALALKERLDRGDIGDFVKTKGYGIHQNWGPAGWFTQKAMAGGGALIDMGVHALDTCRFLMGDPVPVSVYARVDTRFGEYDVDDNGIVLVHWSNNATSIIESGWWHPHMDGPEASTQVFGKKGYARLFPTMARFLDGTPPWLPKFPVREDHCDQHIYDAQMVEFVQAIREHRDPVPGAREGMIIMRICEAAYESARTGEVVHLT